MKKKCKACNKEMTEKEYIQYLEKEVLRLEQELAIAKLSGGITIPSQPAPWITPNPLPSKPWTISWNANGGDFCVPTGGMCHTQCCMYTDEENKCVMCNKTWDEIKSAEK